MLETTERQRTRCAAGEKRKMKGQPAKKRLGEEVVVSAVELNLSVIVHTEHLHALGALCVHKKEGSLKVSGVYHEPQQEWRQEAVTSDW